MSHLKYPIHNWHVVRGKYAIQLGRSAHEMIVGCTIDVEGEATNESIIYAMTSLIGDAVQKPVAAKFMEEHIDDLLDGFIATDIIKRVMGDEALSREEIKGMEVGVLRGLYSQPIQTLKMFLPKVTETKWNLLITDLNKQEQ